ncbi:MAG: hypothetical protein R2809_00035 [Flavobacteriales bacterium]
MSYLSGIDSIDGLGQLNPYLTAEIRSKQSLLGSILSEAKQLSGLGDTEGKVLKFQDVVAKYNKGISEAEIKAWVWYKRKLFVPMKGWEQYYIKSTGKALEDELFNLVRVGALFYMAGELLPFPIYTYGNMYDREVQLEKDKEDIIKSWGVEVYEQHRKAIAQAK